MALKPCFLFFFPDACHTANLSLFIPVFYFTDLMSYLCLILKNHTAYVTGVRGYAALGGG
mgnify:CR=1 FL=1